MNCFFGFKDEEVEGRGDCYLFKFIKLVSGRIRFWFYVFGFLGYDILFYIFDIVVY